MNRSPIYIDPKIDLTSNAIIEIIVQFSSKPLHNDSNKETEENIKTFDKRHGTIMDTIQTELSKNDIPFTIQHIYKKAFNGFSIKIRGTHIYHLLTFKDIKAIYLNKEMRIPTQPNDPRYQV